MYLIFLVLVHFPPRLDYFSPLSNEKLIKLETDYAVMVCLCGESGSVQGLCGESGSSEACGDKCSTSMNSWALYRSNAGRMCRDIQVTRQIQTL